jgi:hypothetical protein
VNSAQEQFLNLKTLPARMRAEEGAWYLGFSQHEIPVLVATGLLKPLGRPPETGVKYFATVTLEELRRDPKWLARASDAIVQYWRTRNGKKKAHRGMVHDAPSDTVLTPPPSDAARN